MASNREIPHWHLHAFNNEHSHLSWTQLVNHQVEAEHWLAKTTWCMYHDCGHTCRLSALTWQHVADRNSAIMSQQCPTTYSRYQNARTVREHTGNHVCYVFVEYFNLRSTYFEAKRPWAHVSTVHTHLTVCGPWEFCYWVSTRSIHIIFARSVSEYTGNDINKLTSCWKFQLQISLFGRKSILTVYFSPNIPIRLQYPPHNMFRISRCGNLADFNICASLVIWPTGKHTQTLEQ